MMVGDFIRWLRDMQVLDSNLTPLAARHIFAHTQLVRTPFVATHLMQ